MDLFVTDVSSVSRAGASGVELPPGVAQAFASLYVPDGMPFFIREDGSYPHDLNGFLRDLPSSGCPSPQTWRAYALDIQGLESHMRAYGRSLIDARFDDLKAYRDRRRNASPAVGARSWNRSVAAFEKFFEWARYRGLIAEVPFRYREDGSPRGYGHATTRRNTLLEAVSDDDDVVKCLTMEQYVFFRDVGLLGRDPEAFRRRGAEANGRVAGRNALVADLLLNSGMRVTETLAILECELPRLETRLRDDGSRSLTLAAATTKRRRSREVRITTDVLRRIDRYRSKDRADAVARALERGAYDDERLTRVVYRGAGRGEPFGSGGERVSYEKLDPGHRARLLHVDPSGRPLGPASVMLGEDGMPLDANAVRMAFARACDRCGAQGEEMRCTPHTLRHTFAVHMMALLLRGSLERLGDLAATRRSMSEEAFREVNLNPVLTLRRMLGHRSVETTYKYLTYVVEMQDFVERDLPRWAGMMPPTPTIQDAFVARGSN